MLIAFNRLEQTWSVCALYEIHMYVFAREGASHVRIDQSLFAPINADFLKRALLFCSS